MTIRYGGADSSEEYGIRLTVEAPDGTSGPIGDIQPANTALVSPGTLWKLGGTDADGGGYKLVATQANDTLATCVMCVAVDRAVGVYPMTVQVLGNWAQIRRLPYVHGAAPSVGQSVKISATPGKVAGVAFDGTSYVLFDDTVNDEVEVLC
jgi:hypothetical protein